MANWKELLVKLVLADGDIDVAETTLLRQEIMADGVVDSEELELLIEIRNGAKSSCPEFSALFFDALKSNILADGKIDRDEVDLLRRVILADGIVDQDERQFLNELKAAATETCAEFEGLLAGT